MNQVLHNNYYPNYITDPLYFQGPQGVKGPDGEDGQEGLPVSGHNYFP